MNRAYLKYHIVFMLLLLVFAWLQFQKVANFDGAKYQQTHHSMNEMIRLDAETKENMLLLYGRRLNHYDELTTKTQQLHLVYLRLEEQLSDKLALQKPLQLVQSSIQTHVTAVSAFKSKLGILRNSQRYFPVLIASMIEQHPEWKDRLVHLNRDVFHFLLEPDNEEKKHSVLRQQLIMQQQGWQQLDDHIKVLLTYAPAVQYEIDRVIQSGISKNAHLLAQQYDLLHAGDIKQMEDNRVGLIALIAVLIIYLSLLLYFLLRAMRQLSHSHDKLCIARQQLEQDIKKRKEAELRYRTLIDASSVAIMIYDEHQFIEANSATLTMFGMTHEEDIFGVGVADVSPLLQADGCASKEAVLAYVDKAKRFGSCSFEWLHQRENGEVFPAYVQLTSLQLEHKQVLQAVVTDLSDLHQIQQENKMLIAALEFSADAVLIGDINACTSYTNKAFEALTGYQADEMLGSFVKKIRSQDIDASVYTNMIDALNAGQIWKGELPIRHKNGSEILTDRSVSPIFNELGEVVSHVMIFRDIREEKIQSQKLEHTQRLESLGVLAGGIAHDFNNILAAIMGNAAMAARTLDDASPVQKRLFKIKLASQRAADLCKQMLAYSGKGQFVIKTIDLSQYIKEIASLMEVSIEKNVLLEYHLEQHLPAVDVDVAQIQQVVLNLITNANEAIGGNSGVISLSTGMMYADKDYLQQSVSSNTLTEGRYAYLEVSDSGCGMDAETQKKVFDPFFTTKFTGRGLGMSAVLGIVRGHQGALHMRSEVGRGTSFKVLLPITDHAVVDENIVATSDQWRAKGTVLVVDDEPMMREVAVLMLEDFGFSTLTAENGLHALEVYRHHQQDIVAVLLDMTMPKMDGQTCFTKLRRINKDVTVIISSGYSEDEVADRFKGKGLAGFIQKPYSPEALAEIIQQAMAGDA